MRTLIVNGSPRPNGNTATLVDSIVKAFPDADRPDVVNIYPMSIAGCRNCGACQRGAVDGYCTIKDDMSRLYDMYLDADLVIFASPIYMWQFTACTNAFMSRLHCMFREGGAVNLEKGKRIAVAMTMGDDEFVAGSVMNGVLDFCEYFQLRYVGAIAVPFADKDQIARPLYQEKISDFVERIRAE